MSLNERRLATMLAARQKTALAGGEWTSLHKPTEPQDPKLTQPSSPRKAQIHGTGGLTRISS